MTDQELLTIYETSYKSEYERNYQLSFTYYKNARDKKYAIEIGHNIIGILHLFRTSSGLEQEIIKLFNHYYKIGASISDTIREIPNLIYKEKLSKVKLHSFKKTDISIEFRKFFGIPYGIKNININANIELESAFEQCESENEIALELGKQRSLIDLFDTIKVKYNEVNGVSELNINNQLPTQYKILLNLNTALINNDLDKFFKIIQSVFASMSYNMKISEGYFHSHIHFLLRILNFKIESEIETNIGRIDSVIETENYIHIIEFKQDNSTTAIEQIKSKQYYQKYLDSKKRIIIVGVSVNTIERNITNWQTLSYN